MKKIQITTRLIIALIITGITSNACQNPENGHNDSRESDVVQSIQAVFAQKDWDYETIQTTDESIHYIIRLAGSNQNMTIHVVINPGVDYYIIVGTPDDVAPVNSHNRINVLTALNEFNLSSQCAFGTLSNRGEIIFSCGVNTDNAAFSSEAFLTNLFAVITSIDYETSKLTH